MPTTVLNALATARNLRPVATKSLGEGPAQRNLDRFIVTAVTPGGTAKTDADGGPVKVDGATTISIDTGRKLQGKPAGTPQ